MSFDIPQITVTNFDFLNPEISDVEIETQNYDRSRSFEKLDRHFVKTHSPDPDIEYDDDYIEEYDVIYDDNGVGTLVEKKKTIIITPEISKKASSIHKKMLLKRPDLPTILE